MARIWSYIPSCSQAASRLGSLWGRLAFIGNFVSGRFRVALRSGGAGIMSPVTKAANSIVTSPQKLTICLRTGVKRCLILLNGSPSGTASVFLENGQSGTQVVHQ